MNGLVVHRPINVPTCSKRTATNEAKRPRSCVQPGVAVFLHPRDASDSNKYAFADSDLELFAENKKIVTRFFGVASVVGEMEFEPLYNTVAVGGTVNMLNTGKWPISQFDTVMVCTPKTTSGLCDTSLSNPRLQLDGHCAIVCSSYYTKNNADLFTEYTLHKVGIALSSEGARSGGHGSHSFLVLLDMPQPHEP